MLQKTILITGGAGYIGSHVSLLLAQKNYHVIILDAFLQHHQPHLPWATVIAGNLNDTDLLATIFTTYSIDAVVHCAAFIEVGQSVADPLNYYKNNVGCTIALLQAMQEHGCRKIIFSSSCAVYGAPLVIPIGETHPTNPISPYGHTKLMVEQILHDTYTAHGIAGINLRYFNAAGSMPAYNLFEFHTPESHVLPLLLRAAHYQLPFSIFGADYQTPDGTCIRDYIHVWDIALAHLAALDYLGKTGLPETFNLGTGSGISVKQMAESIAIACKKDIMVKIQPRRPGDTPVLVADPAKAFDLLGWRPQHSSRQEIVHSAYQGFLCHLEQAKKGPCCGFTTP